MTARMIALLAFAAAVVLLVFMAGHHRGRRSCRNEYPDGWDAGQKAERDRWEDATGTTWDALARWQSARTPEPDFDPEFPPATLLLADDAAERLAEADAALTGKPLAPDVPVGIIRFEGHLSEEEAEEWKRRWKAAQKGGDGQRGDAPDHRDPGWPVNGVRPEPGPPILADITDAARWSPFTDDTPTLTGVIVSPHKRDRTGPEWLEAQLAAMDAEAAAKCAEMAAEVASFRRGINAGAASR